MTCEAVFFNFITIRESENEDLAVSLMDSNNLSECLSSCNSKIQTTIHNDLTKEVFFSELANLAAKDHSQTKYLLIFVSSHGSSDDVIATHDECTSVDDIVVSFANVNCPKIFFIVACHGGDNSPESHSNPSFLNNDNLFRMSSALPPQSVLAYSTPPNRVPIDNESGSWFVTAFVNTVRLFKDKNRPLDIMKILTKANGELATEFETKGEGDLPPGKKQVSHVLHTLSDSLFLGE